MVFIIEKWPVTAGHFYFENIATKIFTCLCYCVGLIPILFLVSKSILMKRKQHMIIVFAILACWLFLAIAVYTRKPANSNGDTSSTTGFNLITEEGEMPNPFTLKAVTTFLLQ